MDSKTTASIAAMSALGALLSALSTSLTPSVGGAALDLSHIATFIAAIFGGPYIGAIVGFAGGIYAGYYFGYVLGSLGVLSLIGIPFGKALTGLTAGFLYKKLKIGSRTKASTLTVPIVLISYIPECLFTIAYFLYIVTYFYGQSMAFMLPLVIPKAWIEVAVMSIIMGALAGNIGFKEFITRYLNTKTDQTSKNVKEEETSKKAPKSKIPNS